MTYEESIQWFEKMKQCEVNGRRLFDDDITLFWETQYQAFKARILTEIASKEAK